MAKDDDSNLFARFFKRLGNKRALKKIIEAGGKQQRVAIKYKKANGEVVKRVIRPYELKEHRTSKKAMLYATDNTHGVKQILSLHADNIIKASPISDSTFKAVWPINLSKKQIKKVYK